MELQKLKLTHFRSYRQEEAFFSPGLNCIEGANGSGKSNLLEAIHLISTGKSFRTHRLYDLIKHSEAGFELEANFIKDTISHSLKVSFDKDGRRIFYNQTAHTSFLPLLGILPSILLCPEDISILSGSPAERRRFLDLHIAQIDKLYVYHLGRYQRALKQRNFLLKKKDEKGLLPWEHLMAISASYIIEKRIETIAYLQEPSKRLVLQFSRQKETFTMKYESSLTQKSVADSPSFYAEQWERNRKKELETGTTLLGPHRDDVLFFLKGQDVKTFCSEGQKRCCLAALRFSEWERLKSILDSPPLFGIDDFGVHLDEDRSSLLKEPLLSMGQVFITAPSFSLNEPSNVLHAFEGTLRAGRETAAL